MPLLPKFVFIAPNASDKSMGSGFILCTVTPFYLGRIIKLKPGPYAVVNFVNEFTPLIYAQVEDYAVVIAFFGNLSGYRVQVSGPGWEKEIQNIFDKMAEFFLTDKIQNNPGYYRRYSML
jgi:hypothetical protein